MFIRGGKGGFIFLLYLIVLEHNYFENRFLINFGHEKSNRQAFKSIIQQNYSAKFYILKPLLYLRRIVEKEKKLTHQGSVMDYTVLLLVGSSHYK